MCQAQRPTSRFGEALECAIKIFFSEVRQLYFFFTTCYFRQSHLWSAFRQRISFVKKARLVTCVRCSKPSRWSGSSGSLRSWVYLACDSPIFQKNRMKKDPCEGFSYWQLFIWLFSKWPNHQHTVHLGCDCYDVIKAMYTKHVFNYTHQNLHLIYFGS